MINKKIAILTGDVHHKLSNNHWNKNEFECMKEEIEIIKKEKIKATFFITGKLLNEKQKEFLQLKEIKDIEFGGHTYSAFQPNLLRLFFKFILNSEYGPRFWQKNDIQKTKTEFERSGLKMNCWRTHSYKSNNNTLDLLFKQNVKIISDKHSIGIFDLTKNKFGILDLCITMPKDEVIEPNLEKNIEWINNYIKLLNESVKKKEMIVMALHPNRMKMLDNFETFKKIIKLLKKNNYQFFKVSDILNLRDIP